MDSKIVDMNVLQIACQHHNQSSIVPSTTVFASTEVLHSHQEMRGLANICVAIKGVPTYTAQHHVWMQPP